MYSVSNAYLEKAKDIVQEHRLTGTIGSVSFTENNIVSGTFNIQKQCTDTNNIVLGSAYTGQLTATFTGLNIDRGAWYKKNITVYFGLKVGVNTWEDIPLGIYKIKEVHVSAEGVEVVAYDKMWRFDKVIKRKKQTLNFVTDSMYDFISLACTKCNVTLGMTKAQIDALPNGYRSQGDIEIYGDAKDSDFANDIETYRDLIFWCAQTMGCFATINRNGQLVFKQYTQTVSDEISDRNRLAGAVFDDYTTHFTGLYFTDMDTNDDTYYGYDVDELLAQIAETSGDLEQAQDDLADNATAQIELDEQYAQGQITEQEYLTQKAELQAEAKSLQKLIKKLTKRLGWLQDELAEAQADDEGATMDCGANPFLQYENLTKRDNTRRRVLAALSNVSYTPFSASLVCGAHYDLGDIIRFNGGHADDDICCVMSWSYTHNQGTEIVGYGADPAEHAVKSKARKEAKKANSTATNTGHTYVAENDSSTSTGAPRGSKNGDLWTKIDEIPSPEPGIPGMSLTLLEMREGWQLSEFSVNPDGSYNITCTGHFTNASSDPCAWFKLNNALMGERTNYTIKGDFSYSGTYHATTGNKGLGVAINRYDSDYNWGYNDGYSPGFHDDTNAMHIQIAPTTSEQHYEGIVQLIPKTNADYLYFFISFSAARQSDTGYGTMTIKNLVISREGATPTPQPPNREVGKIYANDNGEWKEVQRITDVDTSDEVGGTDWNGLSKGETSQKISLKKNVMRTWYKADPPQIARNFSQFCARYTGEPDKNISIESYADHTWENKEVKSDDENAFKIKCGGVGGSGKYCAYKITGLTSGNKYYFNFAVNWSNGATFGNNTTKGLGLVFNTTGTISTDDWSGEPDTFDETNLYYSMRRSTTKNYADFAFTATASTMYMCVVTADVTSNAEINLVLSEFVISQSERKLIRGIYLYDYEKNVWLKYRPFGSVTGGGDEGGGSVVTITPTLLSGTKVADYSIDGDNGSLYAPDNSYTLPIASANTLGGIKVGQNLSIDQNGVLSATGGGGGASSLDDLTDVDITSPLDGQVLKYNNGEWVNGADTGGTQAVELTQQQYDALSSQEKADPTKVYYITDAPSSNLDIDDLQNVNISNPSNGEVLKYDSNNQKWVNGSVSGSIPSLSDWGWQVLTKSKSASIAQNDYYRDANIDFVKPTALVGKMCIVQGVSIQGSTDGVTYNAYLDYELHYAVNTIDGNNDEVLRLSGTIHNHLSTTYTYVKYNVSVAYL